jgi:alkylated DNA repair protein (DNA oxidative demethylase)
MPDLFSAAGLLDEPPYAAITQGAALLRGYALRFVTDIRASLELITAQAPFRHMTTPWGAVLSVAMTNCGEAGWLSDRSGYRYDRVDPESASSPGLRQPDSGAACVAIETSIKSSCPPSPHR